MCTPETVSLLVSFKSASLKLSNKSLFFKLDRFLSTCNEHYFLFYPYLLLCHFLCTIYLAKEVSFEDFFLMSSC